MATSTPAKTAAKSQRRTPAQIAQDELDGTTDKLDKAKARVTRLESDLEKAKANVTSLTSLADYQSSHPALQGQPDLAPDGDAPDEVPATI
jgi:hypothetical protein